MLWPSEQYVSLLHERLRKVASTTAYTVIPFGKVLTRNCYQHCTRVNGPGADLCSKVEWGSLAGIKVHCEAKLM